MRYKPRGLYFSGAYFWRGLSTEGNVRFKIDWASLIAGRKFTVFSLFYFVFEGNFQVQAPRGAYIWRGDLTEGFLRYEFGGLIFGGAYTWRGLFSEFTVSKLPMLTSNDVINFCLFWRQTQERLSKGSVVHQTLAKSSAGFFTFFAKRAKNFPPFFLFV